MLGEILRILVTAINGSKSGYFSLVPIKLNPSSTRFDMKVLGPSKRPLKSNPSSLLVLSASV